MAKDLKTKEGQKSLLNDYLEDLLLNINNSYGPVLLEELQNRLETTIDEFNIEINEAFGLLKKRNNDRKALFSEYSDDVVSNISNGETEWEKKLNEMDKKSK